jgi:hypothetical protein
VRKHFYPLIATTAAALMIAGASAASASTVNTPPTTGATIGNIHAAGYQASGRDFRFITSTLTVPDDSFAQYYQAIYPQEYIELATGTALQGIGQNPGDQYARAGIETCQVAENANSSVNCNGATWVSFVEVFNNSLNGPFTFHYAPLDGVNGGDGVKFSIYDNVQGNELSFTITPPTPAGSAPVGGSTYKTNAYGAIFDHASALDDFTDGTGTPIALPPIVSAFKLNSFLGTAITTNGGIKGSFVGSWTISQVVATSNGDTPPAGTERVWPSALYSDGYSSNGAVRGSDAADIWAR